MFVSLTRFLLVDFGLTADTTEGDLIQMCGSPFWLSPEMVKMAPHSLPVSKSTKNKQTTKILILTCPIDRYLELWHQFDGNDEWPSSTRRQPSWGLLLFCFNFCVVHFCLLTRKKKPKNKKQTKKKKQYIYHIGTLSWKGVAMELTVDDLSKWSPNLHGLICSFVGCLVFRVF